jgi:23S rRNA pseudouridine1911/1915/1917 synthase
VRDPQLRAQIRKLGRQFLHAEQLGFQHPQSKRLLQFTAPLPAELATLLSALEKLRDQ